MDIFVVYFEVNKNHKIWMIYCHMDFNISSKFGWKSFWIFCELDVRS